MARLRTVLAVLVAILGVSSASADPLMKPGKWQIEVKVRIVGSPTEIPPTQLIRCVTPDQAEHPDQGGGENGDCRMSDYKVDGKVVTWTVTCEKQQMKGHGKITYDVDSYEGLVNLRSPDFEMTQEMTGRRTGDCDATE